MDGDGSVVHSPQSGESLEEYLRGFADEEILQICRSQASLIDFALKLQEYFREFENTEDGLERLWNIIRRVNDVDYLLYCINQLAPVRRELLELLSSKEQELKKISKLCTIGRLVGSSVDIAGTIGGLCMRDLNPGYANLVFRGATAFGLLGLISTTSEMTIFKDSLDELMRLIRRDQELMDPIQRWYRQTNELEEAMQEVFPFDLPSQMAADFVNMSRNQRTPVTLLATLLRAIAEQDIRRLRDATLIQSLINFTLYPASEDWVEWIICRRHPIIMDITRIAIQLQHSPLRFALCQSIPALAIGDQSIRSFPVWGRIGLNLVSVFDAINSFRSSETPTAVVEIGHLRNHLRSEMASLTRIAEFITLRRSSRRSPEADETDKT